MGHEENEVQETPDAFKTVTCRPYVVQWTHTHAHLHSNNDSSHQPLPTLHIKRSPHINDERKGRHTAKTGKQYQCRRTKNPNYERQLQQTRLLEAYSSWLLPTAVEVEFEYESGLKTAFVIVQCQMLCPNNLRRIETGESVTKAGVGEPKGSF